TAKDIQEISWERFPLSVDTVDKEREVFKKEGKEGGRRRGLEQREHNAEAQEMKEREEEAAEEG
ncbi:hypothetical protein Tco_0413484, partial [Tanacetum coccineum]